MFEADNFAETFCNLSCTNSEISNTEFEACTFEGCDFTQTKFKSSIFSECHFKSCDLTLANLLDTKFSACRFSSSKLIGIDWSRADWSALVRIPLTFENSTLQSSSFWGIDMSKWKIIECNASDVDFREANLTQANLSNTDFSKALFRNTNLTDANFTDSKNFDIDIRQNKITRAQFNRFEALRLLEGLGIVLKP